jgi:hypothetical protein
MRRGPVLGRYPAIHGKPDLMSVDQDRCCAMTIQQVSTYNTRQSRSIASSGVSGDPHRTRTCNLLIKSQLLCQIELAGRFRFAPILPDRSVLSMSVALYGLAKTAGSRLDPPASAEPPRGSETRLVSLFDHPGKPYYSLKVTSNKAVTGFGAPKSCPRLEGEQPPTSRRNCPGSRMSLPSSS